MSQQQRKTRDQARSIAAASQPSQDGRELSHHSRDAYLSNVLLGQKTGLSSGRQCGLPISFELCSSQNDPRKPIREQSAVVATPKRAGFANTESLEDADASPSPARTDTQTRQKSSAAVQTIDPAAVIAILDQ